MRALRVRAQIDWRAFVLPAVLLAAWWAMSARGLVNVRILVPPQDVVAAALQALAGGDYWTSVATSLGRLFAGFALGALVGIAVGLAIGVSRIAGAIAAPSLTAVRQVSLFAWIPLLTAWFGDGEAAKIALVALAAFFPTALNTEIGCQQVPRGLIEVGRVLEFDGWTTLYRIILPGAVRSIAAGLQIALATAWIGTIGAEYLIDQGTGLGISLSNARIDDRMDLVIVDMITLAAIGLGLNASVRFALARHAARDGVAAIR